MHPSIITIKGPLSDKISIVINKVVDQIINLDIIMDSIMLGMRKEFMVTFMQLVVVEFMLFRMEKIIQFMDLTSLVLVIECIIVGQGVLELL